MDRNQTEHVRAHRRDAVHVDQAARAEDFLRAWWNEDCWDFEVNGESFALRTFAAWAESDRAGSELAGPPDGPPEDRTEVWPEVWDVGAHAGEWAEQAHALLPRALVTSFELVPQLASLLVERAAGRDWHHAQATGLSDSEGTVQVSVTTDTTSAIHPRVGTKFHRASDPVLPCPITTGDAYLARTGRRPPMLLKIDTEGHEAAVLRGCAGLLARPDAPSMIQFEYGDTWIPAGTSLWAVQPWLEGFGYAVGRLFADHVEFKAWQRGDDHFRMGNMIAVRDESLRIALS